MVASRLLPLFVNLLFSVACLPGRDRRLKFISKTAYPPAMGLLWNESHRKSAIAFMSLLLGIVGLVLTFVEIYFPRQAVRLEAWIDGLPARAPRVFYGGLAIPFINTSNRIITRMVSRGKGAADPAVLQSNVPMHRVLLVQFAGLLGTLAICAALGGLTYWLVDDVSEVPATVCFPAAIISIASVLYILAFLVTIVAIVTVTGLKAVVASLNHLTRGKAVGAIGLITGVIGLLLEFL